MTAAVLHLRDYDRRRPLDGKLHDEPAEVIVLPVVRVERYVADIVADARRVRGRRSLLGDP